MITIVGTYFSPIFSATFLHSSDMLLVSQKVIFLFSASSKTAGFTAWQCGQCSL
jgi:hypothetical protein